MSYRASSSDASSSSFSHTPRETVALITISALLFAAGCRRRPETPHFPDAPVILISIDTLRADHLPMWGYRGVETPNIDALGRDGIVFSDAWSHAPMTLPSHVSMLTGLLPVEHGVRDNVGFAFDGIRVPSLPTMLHANGYATGAAVSSYVLRGETGLASCFEFYDDAVDPRRNAEFRDYQRSGDRTAAVAERWIESHRTRSFFFFLHLYEPHVPYEPAEPFRIRYADRPYDGEIATVDAIVGRFVQSLKRSGIYDRAIIILTSDHGEGLGDHGEQQHSILIYTEQLHVPMFLKLPRGEMNGRRIARNVQLADIPPTIMSLLGLPWAGMPHARSMLDRQSNEESIYSESYFARIHLGWSELRSLISGSRHYIESSRPELYDLHSDPSERHDLVGADRRSAVRMKSELSVFPSGFQPPSAIDPETVRAMESLGYLGSAARSATAIGALPSPSDRIGEFESLRTALQQISAGDEREGRPAFDEIVRRNPRMPEAWLQLAETYLRGGHVDRALAAYKEALARSAGLPDEIAYRMSEIYMQQGKTGEAQKLAMSVRQRSPRRGDALLTRIALARNDAAAAENYARPLAESAAALPSEILLLAEVRIRRGDLRGASELVDRADAVGRARGEVPVWRSEFLRGEILAKGDRPREALQAFEREIASFPDDTFAYSHLAVLYFVLGDRAQTNRTLARMCAANPNRPAFLLAASTLESIEDLQGAAIWRHRADQSR
jgi:tetratricopeptide (TPR) repeat protein